MEQDISVSMQTLTPQEEGACVGIEMSGAQPLVICRTCNLNPCCLTSRRSQPPLARSVPLSRFTPRVGGGSTFYVRPHYTHMKIIITLLISYLFGVLTGSAQTNIYLFTGTEQTITLNPGTYDIDRK